MQLVEFEVSIVEPMKIEDLQNFYNSEFYGTTDTSEFDPSIDLGVQTDVEFSSTKTSKLSDPEDSQNKQIAAVLNFDDAASDDDVRGVNMNFDNRYDPGDFILDLDSGTDDELAQLARERYGEKKHASARLLNSALNAEDETQYCVELVDFCDPDPV